VDEQQHSGPTAKLATTAALVAWMGAVVVLDVTAAAVRLAVSMWLVGDVRCEGKAPRPAAS
jgi:hypothetical protein